MEQNNSVAVKDGNLDYDVIIAGAGPAGCCAAIAAARLKMKTLLIEASTAAGGMGTMGMIASMAPFTDKKKVLYHSLAVELLSRYKRRMNISENEWDWVPLSPEDLKIIYDDMLAESGVDILFQTTVCGAKVSERKITEIIAANKEGLTAFKANIYIDCTGDGDLAAFSGAEFVVGDNGEVQASSLCFAISNVHTDRKLRDKIHSNLDDSIWPKVIADGKYPLISRHFVPAIFGDTLIVNGGHIFDINSTDVKQTTNAYILGRKTAVQYHAALKEYLPDAFCDSYLVETAPLLGVRESRRIKGEYTITAEDYFARRSFDDEIARNPYWLDCHPSGKDKSKFSIEPTDGYKAGDSHGIPFRCMIPIGLDNLLVAGRCISVERKVLAATRVMPNCLATGEAAGIAAAIYTITKTDIRNINVGEIRRLMKNQD